MSFYVMYMVMFGDRRGLLENNERGSVDAVGGLAVSLCPRGLRVSSGGMMSSRFSGFYL